MSDDVWFPASAREPAPGYKGPVVRCPSRRGDAWCWHLQGHAPPHEDKEKAEARHRRLTKGAGKSWR